MAKNRNTRRRRRSERVHEEVLPGFFRDFPSAFDDDELWERDIESLSRYEDRLALTSDEEDWRLPAPDRTVITRVPALYKAPMDWDNLLFNRRYRFPDDDELTDYLGTGGLLKTVPEAKTLASRGYTHVVNTASELTDEGKRVAAAGMDFLDNPAKDDYLWKDPEWFLRTLDYAIPLIAQGAKVYVHCLEGVNRGPSNAYAILRVMGYTRKGAMDLIKAKRFRAKARYALEAEEAIDIYRATHG